MSGGSAAAERLKVPAEAVWWAVLPLVLHVPSLYAIFRFVPNPWPAGALYLALALGGSWYALVPSRRAALIAALDRRWMFWCGLAVITLLTLIIYSYADARKTSGLGSDNDDGLITGAQSLVRTGNSYAMRLYTGNPISAGPGWILLVAPLSLTGLYGLLTPLAIAAAAFAARTGGTSWGAINLALALLFSSLAAWHMTVTGLDYIPLMLLLVAVTLGLAEARSPAVLVVLTLALGLLGTARIVFLYWPVLVAFALVPVRGWKVAISVGLAATAFALVLDLWSWATAPGFFPPLHVLGKGQGYAAASGYLFPAGTIALCAVTGALMLANWRRWPALLHLGLGVSVPLLCTGLGAAWAVGAAGELSASAIVAATLILALLLLAPITPATRGAA
ncbi:hypothetical protein [Aquabacter spiritensis]|uniref:DUF2029 domain-containing protein n=1 Tax=Aquabacter spiritensis TaxID=933073 RepID=A0A4R3M620_9HYPH|nr:hypothetical protein [Aquabacter spiritensis]TCT06695.1 hypothetical protein EDC64_102174 [Aquabacter spiritensis]